MPLPDDPSSSEALAAYGPASESARLSTIRKAAAVAEAGFVTWDAIPQSGELWQRHKLSFLEAVHTALAFCDTQVKDEWLMIGRGLLAIVRTLPNFVEQRGVEDGTAVVIGRIGTMTVVYDWKLDPCAFCAGFENRAARGLVQNMPVAFSNQYEQHR
jgi:hypothetical protein